jgi:hypothetical protein
MFSTFVFERKHFAIWHYVAALPELGGKFFAMNELA